MLADDPTQVGLPTAKNLRRQRGTTAAQKTRKLLFRKDNSVTWARSGDDFVVSAHLGYWRTASFCRARVVDKLILGRKPSVVYHFDRGDLPWQGVRPFDAQEGLLSFGTFPGSPPRRFRLVQQSFLQRDEVAFADVLPESEIQAAFDDEGAVFAQEESDLYTPQVTLWAFLSQAVFKQEHRSCVAAVARVVV